MKRLARSFGKVLLLLFLSAPLAGCDGGGGGAPQAPPGSSDWDEMVWDQDNWG